MRANWLLIKAAFWRSCQARTIRLEHWLYKAAIKSLARSVHLRTGSARYAKALTIEAQRSRRTSLFLQWLALAEDLDKYEDQDTDEVPPGGKVIYDATKERVRA